MTTTSRNGPALLKPLALLRAAPVLTFLLLCLAQGQPAHAAAIAVTTTADELNADGDCSLREAIQTSNTDAAVDACPAGSGADAITVPSGTYTLSIAGAGEDANASGDLDITADLTITGAGPATTIIDGAGLDRVFHVDPTSADVMAEIYGVTIQHGLAQFEGFIFTAGGGILNAGTLTVSSSTVRDNTGVALDHFGGGIFNDGTLTLNNSTVSNNAALSGGGIRNHGTATLNSSTVSGNSTFSGGGGIANVGTLTIDNSTISGNTDGSVGGGIDNFSAGTLTLASSTVTGNSGVFGGGIANAGGSLSLKNTIVAKNTASGSGGDCIGSPPIISAGNNLDSDGSCGLTGSGDISGVDLLVGPLADNGGLTKTHPLLAGSPAIDAGSSDCPPPFADQRGVARPQGAACDIGAFELEAPTYNFSGFFSPVDNPPALNVARGGSGVPVKFSLGGDQGLAIFATGYPKSQRIDCDTSVPLGAIEETVTAGSSSLSYDPVADQYVYVWKTNKAWAGTCRQLVVRLNDGTDHMANFRFR